jgi:hypothetical protein
MLLFVGILVSLSSRQVAVEFEVGRGELQQLLQSASISASCIVHFCKELKEFWGLTVFSIRSDC